ncbi:MAG: RNA-directed DNA polymerase [Deltaproteobacteria bacterium]|nr:RNA-directed DNA polymerase [Deltaproteobacteria bacterium]
MTDLRPTPQVLLRLAHIAARGKRRARDVARFMVDVDRHVLALARDLHNHTYRPGTGRCFRITDPKPRAIYALPFRDRVEQHYLIAATSPAIERHLASQTYACRVGKGTHRALRQAIALTRHRRWVLRLDVQKFFASIDHEVLRRGLGPTTPPELRWLRDRFIDAPWPDGAVERVAFHFPGDELWTPIERPHGLPIGSLTSQIWANLYLAPVDHLLASYLGLGDFVRYCDDVLVFSDDRERLREALAAVRERLHTLRLRLHPAKSRLHRTRDPVGFVGFVLKRRGHGVAVRLRQDNVRRMRARLGAMQAEYAAGALSPAEVTARLGCWLAHARHGHTRTLLEREHHRWVFRRQEPTPRPGIADSGRWEPATWRG